MLSSNANLHLMKSPFGRAKVSYRDTLTGVIPGAYEEAFFGLEMETEENTPQSNVTLEEGDVEVKLTDEEKQMIRTKWKFAIIVKLFGRSSTFEYMRFKLEKLWSPSAGMECIDIGYGFYIVRFKEKGDLDKVLRDGPWFVNNHFLSIRKWVPDFVPAKASDSTVAVWIRVPGIPMEYYEEFVLKRIGAAVGPILRFDMHTAEGERGRFARMCVQINTGKPLTKRVILDPHKLPILYEGINNLCFNCGCIGHDKTQCPLLKKEEPSPEKSPWQVTFAQGLWDIWLCRNNIVFRKSPPKSIKERVPGVLSRAAEWVAVTRTGKLHKNSRYLETVSWGPSPIGWCKLNTDGSVLGNPGSAGGAGLIRDSNGDWIKGFFRHIGITTATAAELWAIRDGLNLAATLHIPKLEVETDSEVAYHLLNSDSRKNLTLSNLILECRDYLAKFENVKIRHIFREANACADHLAKSAKNFDQEDIQLVILDDPPDQLVDLLKKDKVGYPTARWVPRGKLQSVGSQVFVSPYGFRERDTEQLVGFRMRDV